MSNKSLNWKEALDLEQLSALIISEQQIHGVCFNRQQASQRVVDLNKIKEELYNKIRPHLNVIIVNKEVKLTKDKIITWNNKEYLFKSGEYNFVSKLYKKSGEPTSILSRVSFKPDGPFSRIDIIEPDISKRLQIIKQLLIKGWKPTIFTDKGTPKLTVDKLPVESLNQIGQFGEYLSHWYVCNHRQSLIQGFIDKIRDDGKLTAGCRPCATNTMRARHSIIANLPRVTTFYGKECRSLLTVPLGYKMVGADLSGLELRCLANRMKDPEYIKIVLEGDVHEHNRQMLKLDTRDQAKTLIYALIYGAGDTKLGKIIGGTTKDGKALKRLLLSSIPSLGQLLNRVQKFSQRGWLPGLDLRRIRVRSYNDSILTHTALNTLLQSDGAIIAKRAMVIAYCEIKKQNLNAKQLIYYHDEFQYEVIEKEAEEIGEILVNSMEKAGTFYKMMIPITGEYNVGNNWGETH